MLIGLPPRNVTLPQGPLWALSLAGALGDGPPIFTGLTRAVRFGTQLKRALARVVPLRLTS
jgi:hypothetical protein